MARLIILYWIIALLVFVFTLRVTSNGTVHPGVSLVGSLLIGLLWPVVLLVVVGSLLMKVAFLARGEK